jgi:hypothetical protein
MLFSAMFSTLVGDNVPVASEKETLVGSLVPKELLEAGPLSLPPHAQSINTPKVVKTVDNVFMMYRSF